MPASPAASAEAVEPLFRYSRPIPRLEATLPPNATITCLVVHTKFLAFGTSAGSIHIFELGAPTGEWRRIDAHKGRILDICLDAAGLQLGTAADDDTVVISSVFNDERSTHNHHAVRAVRLAPDYPRHPDRPFITGGGSGHLWMVRRSPLSWLGGHVEKQIHESLGEGATRAIVWTGSMVAWVNSVCVRVYDLERMSGVALIPAPKDALPQDVCPARLSWESEASLIVAWGTRVTVLSIREKQVPISASHAAAGGGGAPAGGAEGGQVPVAQMTMTRRYGEVAAEFEVEDAFLCGAAPFGEELALLCYCMKEPPGDAPSAAAAGPPGRPAAAPTIELRIATRDNVGRVVHREVLPLKGLKAAIPANLSLVADSENVTGQDGLPLLFAVSPCDVVVAQPRGAADHVDWLVQRGQLADAVAILVSSPDLLPPARKRAVVDAYIKSLFDGGEVVTACAACRELLPAADAEEGWERWLQYAFSVCSEAGKTQFCNAVLEVSTPRPSPGSPAPRPRLMLSPDAYATVLLHLLRVGDAATLLHGVRSLTTSEAEAAARATASSSSSSSSSSSAQQQAVQTGSGTMGMAPQISSGFGKAGTLVSGLLDKTLDKARAVVTRSAAGAVDALASVVSGGGSGSNDPSAASGAGSRGEDAAPTAPRRAPHLYSAEAAEEGAEAAAAAAAAAAQAAAASTQVPIYDVGLITDAVRDAVAVQQQLQAPAGRSGAKGGGGSAEKPPRGSVLLSEPSLCILLRVLVELLELGHKYGDAVRLCLDERVRLFGCGGGAGAAATAPQPPASTTESTTSTAKPAAPVTASPLAPAHLFNLIDAHGLLPLVADRAQALMEVEPASALRLLGAAMEGVAAPASVAPQLRSRPEMLLAYLHHLFTQRLEAYNTQPFEALHALQMGLYERYDRPALLPFLTRSNYYPLEDARMLCLDAKPQPLHRELVFVLSRMGSVKEAVALLVEQLRDVRGAVDVAASFEDEEVWAEVVARVIRTGSGDLVSALLDIAPDTPLSPARLIAAIPPSVPIPMLAARLRGILADREVGRSMVAAGKGLMQRDFMRLINRLIGGQRAGIALPERAACALCEDRVDRPRVAAVGLVAAAGGRSGRGASVSSLGPVPPASAGEGGPGDAAAPSPAPGESGVVVFFCRHAFHESCLAAPSHSGAAGASAAVGAGAGGGRTRGRSSSSASPTGTSRKRVGSSGGGAVAASGAGGGEQLAVARSLRRCPLCWARGA